MCQLQAWRVVAGESSDRFLPSMSGEITQLPQYHSSDSEARWQNVILHA